MVNLLPEDKRICTGTWNLFSFFVILMLKCWFFFAFRLCRGCGFCYSVLVWEEMLEDGDLDSYYCLPVQ